MEPDNSKRGRKNKVNMTTSQFKVLYFKCYIDKLGTHKQKQFHKTTVLGRSRAWRKRQKQSMRDP
jgi:hypothetical protein